MTELQKAHKRIKELEKQVKKLSSNLPVISRSFLRGKPKVGEKLIAIDKCVMESSGKEMLTIGKSYKIITLGEHDFLIKDNANDYHLFDLRKEDEAYWRKFFKRGAKKNGR